MNFILNQSFKLLVLFTTMLASLNVFAGVAVTCPAHMHRKCEQNKNQGSRVLYVDPEVLWEEQLAKDLGEIESLPEKEQLEKLKKEYKKLRKKLHEIEIKAEIKPEQK